MFVTVAGMFPAQTSSKIATLMGSEISVIIVQVLPMVIIPLRVFVQMDRTLERFAYTILIVVFVVKSGLGPVHRCPQAMEIRKIQTVMASETPVIQMMTTILFRMPLTTVLWFITRTKKIRMEEATATLAMTLLIRIMTSGMITLITVRIKIIPNRKTAIRTELAMPVKYLT